ncbi:MAG TPA: FHA domain-containing protein [Acidobacteriota bacterium]|nr:FHA domain-containing protein [Acidobacteriota bacterium]
MDVLEVTITHITGRHTGERHVCTAFPVTIGRAPVNTIQLAPHDTRASARHAELTFDGKNLYLKDLNSTNGTFLKNHRVTYTKLVSGDVVEFGVGGPQLRFEFVLPVSHPPAPPVMETVPAVPPAIGVAGPPPVNQSPAMAAQASAQAGRPPAAPPPAVPGNPPANLGLEWEGNAPSQTTHMGNREFPLQTGIQYYFYVPGVLLTLFGIIAVLGNTFYWFAITMLAVIPLTLLGLFLLLTGWSYSRVNITITLEGIEYQGVWQQYFIPWTEVVALHAERSQTRSMSHLMYTVRGRTTTISFTTSSFTGGLELAQLLTRRTGLKWE